MRVGATRGSKRALFLDRDGVINEEVGYLFRSAEVRWVPGIFPLCRTAQELGYRLIIVTNQSGIARGLYTSADFDLLMDWIAKQFAEQGIRLTAVYHCPFHPEHGVGALRREHPDRKPGPGMLLRGAREHSLDLASSIMVGDRCSDIAAANAAGLGRAFLLDSGPGSPGSGGCPGNYQTVSTLREVEDWLRATG